MYLRQLFLKDLRNLTAEKLTLHPCCNLFYGDNGSGKTSILEAVYLLGRGRSFRSSQLTPVINLDAQNFSLHAKLENASGLQMSLGLDKPKDGRLKMKRDGEDLRSSAELVRSLPLQLINSDSFLLLQGGPSERREFIDEGLFHVEHAFFPLWQRFKRILDQRNAALKSRKFLKPEDLRAWDLELAAVGEDITELRLAYLHCLLPLFKDLLARFLPPMKVTWLYDKGWGDSSLEEALAQSVYQDRIRQRTHVGPHRAELQLLVDGVAVKDRLSRGQSKLFVSALLMARARLMFQANNEGGMVLMDDLEAELDSHASRLLTHELLSLGAQLLLTGITPALSQILEGSSYQMFHVEQGRVLEV